MSFILDKEQIKPGLIIFRRGDGRTRTYRFTGQIFFASVDTFLDAFDFREVIERVVIDVRDAHFWDISAVAALDKAPRWPGRSPAHHPAQGRGGRAARPVRRGGLGGQVRAA